MREKLIAYIGCAADALLFRAFHTEKGNMACGAATAAYAGLKMLFG
jgi:hypothetical protein